MNEKLPALLIISTLFLAVPLYANTSGIDRISIDSGLIFIGNSAQDSAPSPVLRTIGANIPLFRSGLFVISTGLQFWGSYYAYNGQRALPQEMEAPGDLWNWILASMLDSRFGLEYPFNEKLTIGSDAGLSFLLRFPIVSSEAANPDRLPVMQYFFSKGRFLYPETSIYLIWNVYKKVGVSFTVKSYYPVFHLWDGENLPFYDELLITGLLSFIIRF